MAKRDDPSKKPTKLSRPKRSARKKKNVEEQISFVIRMLSFWPTATDKAVASYVKDQTGKPLTRACLQQVREKLGLSEPQYEEKTRLKRLYVERMLVDSIQQLGLNGRSEDSLMADVRRSLREQFGEDTNTFLVQAWVKTVLHKFAPTANSLSDTLAKCEEMKKELALAGLVSQDSRQVDLIG